MAQADTGIINQYLNVILIGSMFGVVFSAVGFVLGRYGAFREARSGLQLALERAARDLRAYNTNVWGKVPGAMAAKALREAEEILWWRSRGANYLAKPTGTSRMRPPDEKRSETRRRERAHNQIWTTPRSDDTGHVSAKELMRRRYN